MDLPSSVRLRHQWGPAPSGSSRHVSVCRRCELREVTDWYDAPGGAVEVTTWVAPDGTVVGSRRIDSHQAPPPRQGRLESLDAVVVSPPREVCVACPGDPSAWARRDRQERDERLDP